MVTTDRTMDQKSLDIKREGKHVGYILWHSDHGQQPQICLSEAFAFLTLSELEQVLSDYREHRKRCDGI